VRKSLLFAAVLLAITALSGRAQASGHVYLLRGLAGIFSTAHLLPSWSRSGTGNPLVSKGAGFKGSISNINLNSAADINHLNIETSNRLHASVISRIQAIAGRQRRASPSAAVQ